MRIAVALVFDALELLARSDETISLRMNRNDITGLRANLDGGASVTVYIAGYPTDAPTSDLLRKPVPGGFLYGLRLADVRFCGTTLSRSSGSGRLDSSGQYVVTQGYDDTPIEGVPVIEQPADSAV